MKQNPLLQAGQFMSLLASVCCTSAPQNGQALINGVETPSRSLLGQLCNICTRGSLSPSVFITAKDVKFVAWFVKRVESSLNSCLSSIAHNGGGTFSFIALNKSVLVASYSILYGEAKTLHAVNLLLI